MIEETPTLLQCIRFFNSKEINEIFTRKEFMNTVSSFGHGTRDSYRMTFCRLGFLEKTGRGKYKRVKDIPDNLTLKGSSYSLKECDLSKLFRELDELVKRSKL